MLTCYFDGACEPVNPGGTGGWGVMIFEEGPGVVYEDWGKLPAKPTMTNNVAEYYAAAKLLKHLIKHQAHDFLEVTIRGDSMMVVKQMSGEWRAKKGHYLPTYRRAKELLEELEATGVTVHWEWIPREKNDHADLLSKKALTDAGVSITPRH